MTRIYHRKVSLPSKPVRGVGAMDEKQTFSVVLIAGAALVGATLLKKSPVLGVGVIGAGIAGAVLLNKEAT